MTGATLNLDARQRAMLEEMGVKVWWPAAQAPLDAIETIATNPDNTRATARLNAESSPLKANRPPAGERAGSGRAAAPTRAALAASSAVDVPHPADVRGAVDAPHADARSDVNASDADARSAVDNPHADPRGVINAPHADARGVINAPRAVDALGDADARGAAPAADALRAAAGSADRAAPAAPSTARTGARSDAPSAPSASRTSAANTPIVRLEPAQRLYSYSGSDSGAASPAIGGWLLVVDLPPGPNGRHGAPFDGDAGRLLQNMLRALKLDSGAAPVHLARTHRSPPGGEQPPFAEQFGAQLQSLAPRVVLALGPCAAQALLHSNEPLGRLRGRVTAPAQHPDVPLVVSYHPAYLLRNPADKARAWADLCLTADAFERGASR